MVGIIYKESVYIAGENQQQATRSGVFEHLLQTDPNLSIEPLGHSTATSKLRFSSFDSPIAPPGGAADFGFLANLFLLFREEGGGGRESLGKRRADKRGQGEGSTRLDYFYTRHADLLGADLEPRSSLALRLPSSSSEYTASVIYFSILERNFILSVGEKNSVFMYFLLLFGSSPSKRLSLSRDFFFVRRRGEEKSASEKLYIFFSIIGSFYPPCYFVGAKNFFNTYRLLIDEVENNVEILKLISKLSDRI